MGRYKHLSIEEREFILCGFTAGKSLKEIAEGIGRHRSTIYRELKRNLSSGRYSPGHAQNSYASRRKNCRPKRKLLREEIRSLVKSKFLEFQWSPQQISERIRLERPDMFVSYSTIYRGIYSGMFDPKVLPRKEKGSRKHLRHKGKPRHRTWDEERRGKIRISNDICDRTKEAEDRSRIGDWEADTVLGKQFYFPLPHQPWQRGTNENANGFCASIFQGKGTFRFSVTNT